MLNHYTYFQKLVVQAYAWDYDNRTSLQKIEVKVFGEIKLQISRIFMEYVTLLSEFGD